MFPTFLSMDYLYHVSYQSHFLLAKTDVLEKGYMDLKFSVKA